MVLRLDAAVFVPIVLLITLITLLRMWSLSGIVEAQTLESIEQYTAERGEGANAMFR